MTAYELVWASDVRDSRLRTAQFARRNPLQRDAVATLHAAVERCFAEVLGATPSLDMFPPVALDDEQWAKLCNGAHVFDHVHVALVIQPRAAQRIVAYAFGETTGTEHGAQLSPLEARVFERFIGELANRLSPVRAELSDRSMVYCELRLSGPLDAIIGLAVRPSPPAPPRSKIDANMLNDCPIECSVLLGTTNVDFFTMANLAVGDVILLRSRVGPSATLNVGPEPIAMGEGGVSGNQTAFRVHELI